jgi:hypothetical protein
VLISPDAMNVWGLGPGGVLISPDAMNVWGLGPGGVLISPDAIETFRWSCTSADFPSNLIRDVTDSAWEIAKFVAATNTMVMMTERTFLMLGEVFM